MPNGTKPGAALLQ